MRAFMRGFIILTGMLLVGCSSHSNTPSSRLGDSSVVEKKLNQQVKSWWGTPYRYGGMSRKGVDCSGFVFLTFRDRFDIQLPRSTEDLAIFGQEVRRSDLLPGDLVFFKTGSWNSGLHVGIYERNNQFIHASTSKGVIRSSLNNVYWRKVYWQARRIE